MNNRYAETLKEVGNATKRELVDQKIHIKYKLAALWTSLMMLFIYADIFSLYRSGIIDKMRSGLMGPFPVTQNSLLIFSALMAIPALMIFVSLALSAKPNRFANVVWSAFFTLVCVSNLIGETWIYYMAYGVIELFICLMILYAALKWEKQ